jgi:1-phosphatidylinositol-4-phosphate 5-kinase
LRKILKDYYQHVVDNPNTLLSQFYGLHRVKMPYGKKIHFVVMNNLFPPHRDIHQTFDLKGSTVGRDYKEEDLERNPRATMKDLNWLRRKKHIELGIHKKQLFLDQLYKDVKLLQRLQIMDYSLLIGIHDLQKGNEENVREKTLTIFNPGGNATEEAHPKFSRTPSVLETQRKARELRQMIRQERPVPVGETLPNELEEGQNRSGFVFNQDDGGFRATREDDTPGDEIYYLGVIDCLTHVSGASPSTFYHQGSQANGFSVWNDQKDRAFLERSEQ